MSSRAKRGICSFLALIALRAPNGVAQPDVPREFRAIWVATVDNMDWPSAAGLSAADQKRELIAILDKAVDLRMNAIILQVRPGADALYSSKLEPWSEYLTGTMGKSPGYDPLEFAVAESHKRGLELHAWINPYRARYSLTRKASPSHISRANPNLVRKYGPYLWMDPGSTDVRAKTKRVVLDIVKRYDIDALHMDDYFYPYKETLRGKEIPFPDASTYKRYRKNGGTLELLDWRRNNVNLLVKELNEGIHKTKPWVRFGISPFGIWRPGYPASVRGLDQYNELYADARKWWNEGWLDYLTPQLYFGANRPQQRYDDLLKWWADENTLHRHLWVGNYTGKVGFTTASKWPADRIVEEIALTRAQPGATGNVHFSAKVFLQDPDSLNEKLANGPYASAALVPATWWLKIEPASFSAAAPIVSTKTDSASGLVSIGLRIAGKSPKEPWLWVVQSRVDATWSTFILPGSARAAVFDRRAGVLPAEVRVMAADRLSNLSAESRLIVR